MLHFVGIGAQKAGTTWLFEKLKLHPDIALYEGKEVHFWDIHYGQGIEWYKNIFASMPAGKICGEVTPAYAIMPIEKIQEAYQHFPSVKLIYIVRDPIARAWSSALMALRRAEMSIDEASDQWFIDHFHSRGSRLRGDYETCLRNWLSIYPKEQLLLLKFDDIINDPLLMVQRCAMHIGINPNFYNQSMSSTLKEKANEGNATPIRPSLLPVLEQLYRTPWNRFNAYAEGLWQKD